MLVNLIKLSQQNHYYFWLDFSFSLNLEEGGNAKITKTQKFKFIYSDDDINKYSHPLY